ncbi:MAG TPA: hypothetical protein PKD99_15150 [Sphingopyxis sp.]|nr:hypothetical protein [Sphingopyxis sp.]HMP46435.1 hypothetical protein [Sphingopyxis sp.]HMQ20468.1 hypothetical protein [Sphingopyxis sp.]
MTDETPEPFDPEPFDEAEYRRRQRSRANLMALLLGALAILFFAITIAKMQIFQ